MSCWVEKDAGLCLDACLCEMFYDQNVQGRLPFEALLKWLSVNVGFCSWMRHVPPTIRCRVGDLLQVVPRSRSANSCPVLDRDQSVGLLRLLPPQLFLAPH